jgi:hypothetical protein
MPDDFEDLYLRNAVARLRSGYGVKCSAPRGFSVEPEWALTLNGKAVTTCGDMAAARRAYLEAASGARRP